MKRALSIAFAIIMFHIASSACGAEYRSGVYIDRENGMPILYAEWPKGADSRTLVFSFTVERQEIITFVVDKSLLERCGGQHRFDRGWESLRIHHFFSKSASCRQWRLPLRVMWVRGMLPLKLALVPYLNW